MLRPCWSSSTGNQRIIQIMCCVHRGNLREQAEGEAEAAGPSMPTSSLQAPELLAHMLQAVVAQVGYLI